MEGLLDMLEVVCASLLIFFVNRRTGHVDVLAFVARARTRQGCMSGVRSKLYQLHECMTLILSMPLSGAMRARSPLPSYSL